MKASLKTVQRLILKYSINGVYLVSSVLPVKKRVVFATHRATELCDNFKFIYQEMQSQELDFEYVFLLKKMKKGLKNQFTYFLHLLKATHYLATSSHFIIDDYYFPVYVIKPRKGTEIIQVWHGCGAFKKFGYSILDKDYGADNEYVKIIPIHKNYSNVLVSSPEVKKYYAEAFNMSEDNIQTIGIPRTDIFFDKAIKEQAIERVYKAYPELKGKKLVLYAPTFRGATQSTIKTGIPFDIKKVIETLDEDTLLGFKMHPLVQNSVSLEELSGALDLSAYPEINELLLVADCLITDYSSTIFEYALLERPMIFYAHDKEAYTKERDFYYDYDELVPGPIAQSTEELIIALRSVDDNLEEIKAFKEKFFNFADGKSSERFVQQLILKESSQI